MPVVNIPDRVVPRIERRQVMGPDGCVVSTYSVGSHGYAQVGWTENGRTVMHLVHRLVYQVVYGPVPDGMTVDHICRNRRCVNWMHLRLLSNRVNATLNGNALKTHCKRGHEFTPENTRYNTAGYRECVTCRRKQVREAMARARARKAA